MTSKVLKIAPLFFILLMTFSAIAYTPMATTGNYATTTPQIQASFTPSPIGSSWVNDSTAYAVYNGHYDEHFSESFSPSNDVDFIMTANLTVAPNGKPLSPYSNLTVRVFEFFTGAEVPNIEGLWYNISTAKATSGKIPLLNGMRNPTSGTTGNYSFFYVPSISGLTVGSYVKVTAPFDEKKSINFYVNKTETILGIATKQLFKYSYSYIDYGGGHTKKSIYSVVLWISDDTQGLLMRMKGYSSEDEVSFGYYRHQKMDMSLEIGKTNIVALTPPEIPVGVVPWMSTGKYIQYNLQGSGYIDASVINHTSGNTWALPGDTKFRTTVSANLTMKVVRGTTAWVDPWNSTRYLWIVHLMLNNTKLLLPDLRRTIQYLNQTVHAPIPYPEAADFIISTMSPFNHTGLVTDTWFLVDNATGIMLWPGIHLGALSTFNPSAGAGLGELLSQGLGFEVLSYFAQSVLYQGWSIPLTQTIPPSTYHGLYYTQTTSGTAMASITAVGTKYLDFPGGGGGHCWHLVPSVNVHVTQTTMLNRSAAGYPKSAGSPMGFLMQNGTYGITGSGYIDVERTSGFPLAFDLQTTFTLNSEARAQPWYWLSAAMTLFLDLSATVPKTNIWFSNRPVLMRAGAGGNATTPPGYFGDFGFDVWTNGADNVTVTSSASQPPDTGTPPPGTLPFIYLSVAGVKLPGSTQIILYVYYNRTKVLNLGIDENSLKIYIWNTTISNWQALQSTHLVLNATHGVLFAVLPHLSYFAVLGSPSTSGGGAIPTTYILIAAVAVIVVLAAVVFMKRRKGGIK